MNECAVQISVIDGPNNFNTSETQRLAILYNWFYKQTENISTDSR